MPSAGFCNRIPRKLSYPGGQGGIIRLFRHLRHTWRGETSSAEGLSDTESRVIHLDRSLPIRPFGGALLHELLHQSETPLASQTSLSSPTIHEHIITTLGNNLWEIFCRNPDLLLRLHECATRQEQPCKQ